MKIKIIGVERKDYEFDGISFHGNYVHCAKVDEPKDGLLGDTVTQIKIPDGHKCAGVQLDVGKHYTVYFNDKKQVDFLVPFDK